MSQTTAHRIGSTFLVQPSLSPNSPIVHYPPRALILFTLGFAFSVIIDHFQQEHDVTRFPRNGAQVFSTASWVTLSCGAAGCLVGTMYPMLDYYLSSTPHACNRDWPSVLRCTAGFIGVNYATAKLTGTDGAQISLALSICAVGLWFMFDRTWYGFLLSLLVAIIGTWAAQFFVSTGFYIFTKADFFGVRSWFPCMLYSGSVLFGSIGRQLGIVPHELFARRQARREARRSRKHPKAERG